MKELSNTNLIEKLKSLVGEERKTTALILDYLNEVDSRKLYLELGYPSLFEFCVQYLCYSESGAFRRISSMRMIKNLPDVREKIVTGELTLSVVAQAQSFFKKQERSSRSVSQAKKLELLKSLENKSSRACERALLNLAPEIVKEDRARAITAELTELRLTVDKEFMETIEKLKNLLSHSDPDISIQGVIKMALDQLLLRKDPSIKKEKMKTDSQAPDKVTQTSSPKEATDSLPTSEVKASRYVPSQIKRDVWIHADSTCSFVSPITGKVCGSKKFLEIDHKIPFSKGGTTQIQNLQLLCDQHNRFKGNKTIGRGEAAPLQA